MSVLTDLISKDYRIKGNGRWLTTEEHDSLVIDTEKDIFFWNSKNIVGDALVWLTDVKYYNINDARRILRDYKDYEGIHVHIHKKGSVETVVLPELVDIFWERGKYASREYWYERCLTDQTIDRFKLGYYNEWNLIPIIIDSTFKNFQMRKDLPQKLVSQWYKGIGPLLFNSDILKLTGEVFLVEGIVDAILLSQEGIPAVSTNTGANAWAFTNNRYGWFHHFLEQKRIYAIFDNDDAGIKGAKSAANQLGLERTLIYTFDGFYDKYDIINFFQDGGRTKDFLELVRENSKYAYELGE